MTTAPQAVGPPTCSECGAIKTWKPPGISRTTGAAYEGFWACPNYKQHPKGKSAGYPKTSFQARQAAPGSPIRPFEAQDAKDRAISAAAACKAACEAFAGAGLQGMGPDAQHGWIVALAQRLLTEVIAPQSPAEQMQRQWDREPGEDDDVDQFLGR